jgi:hypothetical protein
MRGVIKGCFHSPHPNPLQQERELGHLTTHCIYNAKNYVDSFAHQEREQNRFATHSIKIIEKLCRGLCAFARLFIQITE